MNNANPSAGDNEKDEHRSSNKTELSQNRAGSFRKKWWLSWVLFIGATVVVFFLARRFDGGAASLVFGIGTTLVILWLLMLLVTEKRIPRGGRLALVALPVGAVLCFVTIFEFVNFTGDLVPQFRYRFGDQSSRTIVGQPDVSNTSTDSLGSFNRYLGPTGDGNIVGIEIDPDWQNTPPKIRWRKPIGAGWSGFAIVGNNCITLEQIDQEESVTCVSLKTGELIWQHRYPAYHFEIAGGLGPRSTPTVSSGRVYTLGATGELYCLDLKDGTEIWHVSLLELANISQARFETDVKWGRAASVLLHEGNAIVPAGPGDPDSYLLAAFDELTGELKWRGGKGIIAYTTPTVAELVGVEQFVTVNEDQVCGQSISDGSLLWSFSWPGKSNGDATNAQPIILDENRIFISKGYGTGAAIISLTREGEQIRVEQKEQSARVMRTKFSLPIRVGDYIYALSRGIMECVEIKDDGKDLKRAWKRGRYGHGQMLRVGDHFLISAEDGRLVLIEVNSDELVELGELQVLEGTTWNPLAIVGNQVLMRNGAEMACVEIPLLNQPGASKPTASAEDDSSSSL